MPRPRLQDARPSYVVVLFTSLGITYIVGPLLLPLTRAFVVTTFILYFYLRNEHLLNSALVCRTPDNDLPSHSEWVANEGLKKVPSLDSGNSDLECCICRDVPNDPTQIKQCGHIFCAECITAWHEKGHRSCPQCTIKLWRSEGSDLEKLVKFIAAQALVAVPLTVFALYLCLVYHIFDGAEPIGKFRMFALVGFVLLSAVLLSYSGLGLWLMRERRREHGIKWWGADLDPELDQACIMASMAFFELGTWWLLIISLILETYVGGLANDMDLKILAVGDVAPGSLPA